MSKTETSQTHNESPFNQMAQEHVARMNAYLDRLEELQAGSAKKMGEMVDEMARLTRAGIDYQLELSAEWRRWAQRSMDFARNAQP